MSPDAAPWYAVSNVEEIPSPALLVYSDRIEENVRRMLEIAGSAARLRPHIKTHKLPELVRMQMAHGITRFKSATIAEAEMAASCGAAEVLLAYQPVGPNIRRLVELAGCFPATRFSAIVDDPGICRDLSEAFSQAKLTLDVLLDIDCGMHRTGVTPDERASQLYEIAAQLPGLVPGGLHVYDGQIHDSDLAARIQHCHDAFAPVLDLRSRLLQSGWPVPRLIAGGTPTFPIHARRQDVECSPGTCILWDAGYSARFPDLDFLCAALVLTRVVSKPGAHRLCLDLGHKAIASEGPPPRVHLLGLPDARAITHSEEHLVMETPSAADYSVGDCLYGIPWHICPTVALHSEVVAVKNGRAEGRWKVVARQRMLTV